MTKLLIIADDFTGALDTGVQFACEGIKTRVLLYDEKEDLIKNDDTQVLVIDAETRHLPKEEAYNIVYSIVKKSKDEKIPYIYKKTDSALRGNIGSELKALIDGSNSKVLPFIPAFPKMNRITKNGVHYIDGVIVEESVFGKDPFEPVKYSLVKDIINSQENIKTTELQVSDILNTEVQDGIIIYDAQRDEDLITIGEQLKEKNICNIIAGCAGFAAILPKLLELSGDVCTNINLDEKLLVVCGSVNPITKSQLEYAQKYGFKRIHLNSKQKVQAGYWDSEEGLEELKKLKYYCENSKCCILDSNDKDNDNATFKYAKSKGKSVEEVRSTISKTMGYVLKNLLEQDINSTLLVTGGDTLLGFMKQIGINELIPICELMPGCVLTKMKYKNKIYHVISKSGGFGPNSLIKDISELLKNREIDINDKVQLTNATKCI